MRPSLDTRDVISRNGSTPHTDPALLRQAERNSLAAALESPALAAILFDGTLVNATYYGDPIHSQIFTAARAVVKRGPFSKYAVGDELLAREWQGAWDYAMTELPTVLPWEPEEPEVRGWLKTLIDHHDALAMLDTRVKAIDALMAGDTDGARQVLEPPPARAQQTEYTPPPGIPELPDEATLIYEHIAPCAAWLDDYIEFAQTAAPMTPYVFLEAAGLMVASIAVARRMVVRPSTTAIYPNLFMLVLADSTLYSKTTGMRIVDGIFAEAGLSHMLLPQRMTPEAFVQDLGTTIPSTLSAWDIKEQAQWLKERAIAAQRGWVLDEASRLFDSFKRDFNTGLLPLMLDLYECPNLTREQTISRGRTLINDAYLSFFGAATPSSMHDHLQNKTLWTNGLWARFVIVVPDSRPDWCFFPPRLPYPPDLLGGLRRLAYRFPMPSAAIEAASDHSGQERQAVVVRGKEEPLSAGLGAGVWEAWEQYCKALRYTLLLKGDVPPALYASYGRLGIQALKVAMLLAAMDGEGLPVTVERRHFARAQHLTEQWRGMLHQVWGAGVVTEEATQSDRVLALLAQTEGGWLATREIYRPLGIGAQEARGILEELVRGGQIEPVSQRATNGRMVEGWRLLIGLTR